MEKTKKQKINKNEIIAIIRISGDVKVKKEISEGLNRLRLKRKYSCVVLNSNELNKNIIKKIKYCVAYGPINKEILKKLLEKRAKSSKGEKRELKIDFNKTADEIFNGKKLGDMGLKPFFRLHPPLKGINSKLQYPQGVLGDNKEDINKLIERML